MSNERASVLAGPHTLHSYQAVSAPPGQPAQLPYPQVLRDQYHIKNENLYQPAPRFTHTSQPQWQQQQQLSYNQLPRGQPSPGQYPPYAQGPYQSGLHPQQQEYNQHVPYQNGYIPQQQQQQQQQQQWRAHQQQQQPSYNQLPRGQPSPGQYPPYAQGPYQSGLHPHQQEYNQHVPYQNGYIPQQQQQQQWRAHQQQQHPHTAQQYPYSSHHPNVVLAPPVYDDDDDEKYRKSIAICFLVCCCACSPLMALLFLPAIICYFMGKRAESRGGPRGSYSTGAKDSWQYKQTETGGVARGRDEFPQQPAQPPSTTPMQQFPPYVPAQPPPPYPPQVPMDQYYPAPSGAVYPPQPQQQQSSNVVVVSSQPAPTPVIITHQPHAPDYLILTIVGFLLCFLFGAVVGMLLLIPALICSVMAQDANSNGDYENAKSLGRASLIWNIIVYIFITVVVIVVVIAVVVVRVQAYNAAINEINNAFNNDCDQYTFDC